MTEKLKVTYRKVDDLIPYARNARTHSAEQVTQIASSIKEFGFCNPVLVDGESGIIAGHGRVMAAKKLGLDEVPTIELTGLSEAQKRAFILADNKIALNSGWDEEMLELELTELKDLDFDLGLTGFNDDEIGDLLDSLDDRPQESETAEVPEVQEDPKSKRGDVWVLGVHRCMCGDSCDSDDVSKLVGGGPSYPYI